MTASTLSEQLELSILGSLLCVGWASKVVERVSKLCASIAATNMTLTGNLDAWEIQRLSKMNILQGSKKLRRSWWDWLTSVKAASRAAVSQVYSCLLAQRIAIII